MEVTRRVSLPVPVDDALQFLSDLVLVLPCVPGAELGEPVGDGTYRATITVSAGEFSVSFAGLASMESAEPNVAVYRASGSDRLKTIHADAEVRVTVEETGGTTSAVDIMATFDFSGFLAPAARAGGGPAARLLMRKFAANLAARVAG